MSDSSAGQIVGGVVGSVVGFVAGGPVGSVQGFSIGYGIGGYIDPPDGPYIKAPTLDDQTFQSSAYGTDIPTIDGTVGLNGNVIYLENGKYKQVTTSEEQGGKGGGGGATVESVQYFATFAVSLCEAVPNAKIRRVWLGGKLFYNNASTSAAGGDISASSYIQSSENSAGFTFYDGTQTEPDDRIESILPAGEAESYEGTAYIIFKDLDLGPYGNSMQGCPVKVEIATVPDNLNVLAGSYSQDYTIASTSTNGRWTLVSSLMKTSVHCSTYVRNTIPNFSLSMGRFVNSNGAWSGSTNITTAIESLGSPPIGINDGGVIYETIEQAVGGAKDIYQEYQSINTTKSNTGLWVALSVNKELATGDNNSFKSVSLPPPLDSTGTCVAIDQTGDYVYYMDARYIYKYSSELLLINQISISGQGADLKIGIGRTRMWHDGVFLWVGTSTSPAGTLDSLPSVFYRIPSDFSSISHALTLPQYGGDGFADSPSEFVVKGNILSRAGVDGTTTGTYLYEQWAINTVGKNASLLSSVCSDIAVQAGVGLDLFDTSDLVGDFVRGYIRPVGDGRGALSQLQAAFLFDVVQVGYKLKAIKRGANPVLTIPYGDLGAKKSGSSPVDRLGASRQMDTVLPSKMEVRYLDALREYDIGSQSASYPTSSFNVKQVDFALSLNNDEAAKLADVLINAAWSERTKFNFSLPQSYLSLIVSDVVNIETPDRTYQVRIESINTNENQTLQVAGALSAPALWESDAKGAEGVIPDDNVKFVSDSQAVLIDTAMIFNDTDVSGFAAQMRGGEGWEGASLLRSIDGGQTYNNLSAFTTEGASATANNTLSESEGFVIERGTMLNVSVLSGEFSSITEAQMMNGQHWCAYGQAGRWEVIRFTEATVNVDESLTLSGFVRGARGTEWATGLHAQGDMVFLLDGSNTQFITADIERIGVTGNYKAVTFGQSPIDVTGDDFTYRGENLKPLSPVNPDGVQPDDDWLLTATSRTRYTGNFWLNGTQPINEPILSYEADILNGSDVVRTLKSNSLYFTYTLGRQLEDFGSKQNQLSVIFYQLSERVGRGNGLSAVFESEPDPADRVYPVFSTSSSGTDILITDNGLGITTSAASARRCVALMGKNSGVWCFEVTFEVGAGDGLSMGATYEPADLTNTEIGKANFGDGTGGNSYNAWGYFTDGYHSNLGWISGAAPTSSGGTSMIVVDLDNHIASVIVTGQPIFQIKPTSGPLPDEVFYPIVAPREAGVKALVNFGETPFVNTVPVGCNSGWYEQ